MNRVHRSSSKIKCQWIGLKKSQDEGGRWLSDGLLSDSCSSFSPQSHSSQPSSAFTPPPTSLTQVKKKIGTIFLVTICWLPFLDPRFNLHAIAQPSGDGGNIDLGEFHEHQNERPKILQDRQSRRWEIHLQSRLFLGLLTLWLGQWWERCGGLLLWSCISSKASILNLRPFLHQPRFPSVISILQKPAEYLAIVWDIKLA